MAIRLDAGTDYLIGSGWGGNVVTITCWVKLQVDTNTFANPWLVFPNSGGAGVARASLGTIADGTTMKLFDAPFAAQTGPNMSVGTWYCFGAVMNNTTWTFYYGTTPSSLTTVGPNTRQAFTAPGSFTISDPSEPLNGDIGNFKIFTAALTSGQVATELTNYEVDSGVSANLVRRHTFKTTSLTPEAGSSTSDLTAGSTAVALAAAPPVNDFVTGVSGIASADAFGTPTLGNVVTVDTGIASTEAFGTLSVNQNISGITGIASAEAFSGFVLTQGQTIATFGIATAEAFGSHSLHPFPFLVQAAHGFVNSGLKTKTTNFTAATATAGNVIVFAMAGNRNIGTLTLTGLGWNPTIDLRQDRVSLAIWWKVAAGGETGVIANWTTGNDAGSQTWIGEYSSALIGIWTVMGSATSNTDGTNVINKSTGTTQTVRHNLCPNPSLKIDTTNWFGGGSRVTNSTGMPRATAYSDSSGTETTAPKGDVTEGLTYRFSAYIKGTGGASTGQANINWYSGGGFLSTGQGPVFTVGSGLTTRIDTGALVAPATADQGLLNIINLDSGVEVTGLLYEQTSELRGFFDGDSSGAVWDGTDGKSESTYTASLIGDGVSIAQWAVENVVSNSVDSASDSYTLLFTQGSGVFEAGQWIASKNVFATANTESTLTRTSPVTAKPMSGALLVLGKAVIQGISPTGIASTENFGDTAIFGIGPTGIASAEAFGNTTVSAAAFLAIAPTGIESGEAIGEQIVHFGSLLFPSSIDSSEAFGTPVLDYPARLVRMGQLQPSAFYVGEDQVSSIYYGENLLWS